MRTKIFFLLSFFFLFLLLGASAQKQVSVHQKMMEKYAAYNFKSEKAWDEFHGYKPSGKAKKQRSVSNLNKIVYGWYPYWNGSEYNDYDYSTLTDIAYFSYEVNAGTGGYDNIYYWETTDLINVAHSHGCRVHLTATCFGSSDLNTLLSSSSAKQNLIDNLVSLVKNRNADGVCIDFELMPTEQRNNLTAFMNNLGDELHAEIPGSTLSIALPAVDWGDAFDVGNMTSVDLFLIMGYDYYWKGGNPGPVAPKNRGGLWTSGTATRSINYFIGEGVPNSKLALGVPYYGYDWETTSSSIPGTSTGSYATAKVYSTAVEQARTHGRKWDDHSQTPYYIYNDGSWHQCWYEDEVSLGLKYDLVNATDIAGIGIWALGQDGDWTSLQDVILEKFGGEQKSRSGGFYDMGGPEGNYFDNEDYTFTIDPPGDYPVKITFNSFDIEANYDYLYIYDGTGTNGNLIGTYTGSDNPGIVISETNALTFRFTSDGATTRTGWNANWSTVITDAEGTFTDKFGSSKNYGNNEEDMFTIAPPGATSITVSFTEFNIEKGYDFLYVYDGANTSAPLIGTYHGADGVSGSELPPASITSSGGSLTFKFVSDYYTVKSGWVANWTSQGSVTAPEAPTHVSPANAAADVATPVTFDWQMSETTDCIFRLQVSTSSSGWTANNGFTAESSASESIPVNVNTDLNSTFSWNEAGEGVFAAPAANTTYYWTVRAYRSDLGVSEYSQPQSFTTEAGQEIITTIIDDFEIDEGHFDKYLTYSGTTVGIDAASTNARVTTDAKNGNGSLELVMVDDANSTSNWKIRMLSGSGSPANNTAVNGTGKISFWMKTSTASSGAQVYLWIDDSDGLEQSPKIDVINDGAWHLYEWDLDNFGGVTITTGNGEIDGSTITIDAIMFDNPHTTSTWTLYIDDVMHSEGQATDPPVAGFSASQTTVAAEQSVSFTNSSTNAVSYLWTFEGGNPATSEYENPQVTYPNAGNYDVTLTVTDEYGNQDTKTMSDYITVIAETNVATPDICIVSVNQSTDKNVIYWQKPTSDVIASYNIYKESNEAGNYTLIGTKNYTDAANFEDSNSEPSQQADRYKISAVDIVGQETPMSAAHKTIHLAINEGINGNWNLIWDSYEGFSYGTFNIYRGTSASDMTMIDQIQSTLFSYTDINPPTGTLYYCIEVVSPNDCGLLKSGDAQSSSRSNIVEAKNTTALPEWNQETMRIYPNPARDFVRIEYPKTDRKNEVFVTIYTMQGQMVKQYRFHSHEINVDIGSLQKGVYIFKVKDQHHSAIRKVIKK